MLSFRCCGALLTCILGALVIGGVDPKKYKSLARVHSSQYVLQLVEMCKHLTICSFRAYLTGLAVTLPNGTNVEFDPDI
jgi:hypothetical protein